LHGSWMAQPVLFAYKQRFGVFPTSPSQLLAFSRANSDVNAITYVQARDILANVQQPANSADINVVNSHHSHRSLSNSPPVLQNSESADSKSDDLVIETKAPQYSYHSMSQRNRHAKYQKHQQKYSQSHLSQRINLEDLKNADSEEEEENEEIQKMNRLRKRAVDELVQTEKTYVSNLEKLFKVYVNPLRNTEDKQIRKLLSMQDHAIIFAPDLFTIYALHIQLNADLIKATTKWDNETSKIGQIFIKYGELFKMYQDYFHKHEKAVQHLMKLERKNTKFAKWSMEQSQKVSGLTIQALLILPIQRLPRYEMLLKEIIKRTKKYHIDMYDLQEANEQINEVTELINAKMKEHDRRIKVTMVEKRFIDLVGSIGHFVQPSRIFIAESSENPYSPDYIIRHDKFGNQIPITVFLFNDCLIYGYYEYSRRVSSPSADDAANGNENKPMRRGKLRFGSILVFDELFAIHDVPFDDEYNYKKVECLKLQARHHSMWISFHSYNSKLKWFDMITQQNQNIILQNLNARRRSAINRRAENNHGDVNQTDSPHKDELDLPLPVFVPDDYSDICMICKAKFGVLLRRHHCYFCGKLCCSKCTPQKMVDIWKLHFEGKKEYVRACETCKTEREEYLQAKQNKYMYYRNDIECHDSGNQFASNSNVSAGIEAEGKLEMMDNDDKGSGSENENEPKLLSQTTFDITKGHLSSGGRVSKRREKMNQFKSMRSVD